MRNTMVLLVLIVTLGMPTNVTAGTQDWVEIPLQSPMLNAVTSVDNHGGQFELRGSAASDQELRIIDADIEELDSHWNDRAKAVRIDCDAYPDTNFDLYVDKGFEGPKFHFQCLWPVAFMPIARR